MNPSRPADFDELVQVFSASHPEQPASPTGRSRSGDGSDSGRPHGRWRMNARRLWTAVSWAGVAVVAVLVVAIAAVIVVPRAMGWQGMVVLSGSMEPALKTGGLAFVEPVAPDEAGAVKVGDILTYRQERLPGLISHRVVDTVQDEQGLAFVTRGDANNADDGSPIPASRVVGVVRFDLPYLGSAVRKLQDRKTYYLFLGIPAGLLIATELWHIGAEVRRARREDRAKQGAVS